MSLKRGISGRGRGGSPPLPRQRRALRVVQLTMIAVAVASAWLADTERRLASGEINQQVIGLAATALLFAAAAGWMGIRIVRGPRPPPLD